VHGSLLVTFETPESYKHVHKISVLEFCALLPEECVVRQMHAPSFLWTASNASWATVTVSSDHGLSFRDPFFFFFFFYFFLVSVSFSSGHGLSCGAPFFFFFFF
jgi:hypothetical protein